MIGAKTTLIDNSKNVTKAVDKAAFRNMGHAAARITIDAKESIEVAPGPSPPGTPPHTRRKLLPRAIRYDYDRKAQSAVIGPRYSVVGEAGAAHEFGGEFRGDIFDERSFMAPALENNLGRFASDWAGSVGE